MARGVRPVVVGVDGSAHSRRAVTFLTRLYPTGRAVVVSVVEPVRAPSLALVPGAVRGRIAGAAAALEESRRAAAHRHVEAAARELEAAGWRTRSRVVSGVPLAEILRAVEDERADLLVLGARGTSGLERVLLGSVSDGALKHAPVSVLIVK
jgi:nucleotide-binding universal stress UspA family protein